jgi:hypothetical protein
MSIAASCHALRRTRRGGRGRAGESEEEGGVRESKVKVSRVGAYPRPTNGILVAIKVMKRTLVSSGRFAQ